MINRETAGKELLELRLKHKLTQIQLAEKTNISVKTISAIESGGNKPQSMTLYKLNRFFLTYKLV